MDGGSPSSDGGFACRACPPAGGEVADFYLEKIREFVLRRSRLCFEGPKKAVLRQRLETRLQQLGLAGLRPYWEYLLANPGEQGPLFDQLTTNETFFFRNPEQFRHLREVVLPELELVRGRDALRSLSGCGPRSARSMKLRILSAGCSTGEEPYSAAMTVLEALRYPKAWDIEIIAGDLSGSCLEAARAGCYGAGRLRGIAPGLMEKYLTAQPDGGAVVRDELRQMVKFAPLNLGDLMNGELPAAFGGRAGFDIIFCRNVMIYFSPASQQLLVETLHRLLAPGGYLLTGDAEPLHLFNHDFVAPRDAGCLIYQKTEKNRDAIDMR